MYLILVFALALLGCGRSANVNKHMRLLDLDNHIENHAPPTKQTGARRFLTITQRPRATYALSSGDVLELTCDAVGAPAPSIHWFRNDAPVYEYDVESNELIDSNPTSLARVISTLLVSKTSGHDVYTCLVTAGAKTARATTVVYSTDGSTALTERAKLFPLEPRIVVTYEMYVDTIGNKTKDSIIMKRYGSTALTERAKLFPLEPRIVVTYEMYVDTIGNNIVLPCRVKGHPKPHVSWIDNKGNVVKKDERMKVLRSGELVISSLRWSDMGEFSCQATNVFGSQLAKTFVYPAKAG